jgi:hypothetical protein
MSAVLVPVAIGFKDCAETGRIAKKTTMALVESPTLTRRFADCREYADNAVQMRDRA